MIRKKFRCPYCSFSAMHQCILKRHMRSHTGERPYPCEICGKKFTRREHMKRHTLVSGRPGPQAPGREGAAWGRHGVGVEVGGGGAAQTSGGSSRGRHGVSSGVSGGQRGVIVGPHRVGTEAGAGHHGVIMGARRSVGGHRRVSVGAAWGPVGVVTGMP